MRSGKLESIAMAKLTRITGEVGHDPEVPDGRKIAPNASVVTLSPSGRQFESVPGASILTAGLSAGVALPYGCANGSCGDCRAQVLAGEVASIQFHDYPLTQAEKIAGIHLMCAIAPVGEVVLQVSEASSFHDIAEQTLKAKRCRLENPGSVCIAAFKFVRGQAFRFLPGQSARLTFGDGHSVLLPIASCPCNSRYVEFHVPNYGVQSQLVERFETMTNRDRVSITGPVGTFTLSQEHLKPKIFYALGEGFGSIQGLIEQVINLDLDVATKLIWQSTNEVDHYLDNLARSWSDALDDFQYYPVWTVDDGVSRFSELLNAVGSNSEVYLSGPEADLLEIKRQLESQCVLADNVKVYTNSL